MGPGPIDSHGRGRPLTLGPIAILGAGGMGTAMAVLLGRSGHEVRLWSRRPEHAERLKRDRENVRYLPGIALPESIRPLSEPCSAVEGVGLLIASIPSSHLRGVLEGVKGAIPSGLPALSVIKGIEQGSFARPSEIIAEALGPRPIAVLSGPSHAEEIAQGLPASVVVAGTDEGFNHWVRDGLTTDRFRVYSNADAVGVELAGALKNVMGVAAGICDGLGFGDNAKAGLLTRGLAEMTRFGVASGGLPETFLGLAGVGDLITTCYSPFGRNRMLGERIGRGESLEAIEASTPKVAEGVPTCRSVDAIARRRGIEMPITALLREILFEGKDPRNAVDDLMERRTKDESP